MAGGASVVGYAAVVGSVGPIFVCKRPSADASSVGCEEQRVAASRVIILPSWVSTNNYLHPAR